MSKEYCLVYCTCPLPEILSETKSSNQKSIVDYSHLIAKRLVLNKLAACVNIIENITSIYTWEKTPVTSQEKLLIIKTTTDLFEELKETIIKLHPYSCPEIIVTPITNGFNKYFSWIDSSLKIGESL